MEREKNLPRLPFKEAVRILSHLPLNLYYVTKTWSWRCRYGVKLSVVSAKCFNYYSVFCIQYTQKPFAFNTPYPRSVCFWWKMFGSSAKSSTSSCLDVFQKLMDFHNQGTRLIKLCYIMYKLWFFSSQLISAHIPGYLSHWEMYCKWVETVTIIIYVVHYLDMT